MRQLSEAELNAIALLMQQPQTEREIARSQKRIIPAMGAPLPIIHQVLFS